jgi:uncharacterized OsmC-like protein
MNRASIRSGIVGGILGGVVMAIWLMFILWLTGTGFWTLLNLITNTVWRTAPLSAVFSVSALVIGLAVHVAMSVLFGVLIAAAAWRLPGTRSLVIAGGALFAAVLWAVMQYGIWRAVDPAAARVITPWVFAVAHLIFGVLAASTAAIVVPDAEAAPAAGRHALSDAGGIPATALSSQQADTTTPGTGMTTPGTGMTTPGIGPVPHWRTLTAYNEGGMRTVTCTSGGPGMVTDEPDEPAAYGGTWTALTPLETVIGALCGSAGITFAKVAREVGFGYDGIDFEASFTVDPRDLAGEQGMRSHIQAVRVRAWVRGAEPDAWLADVAQITERRCPVRNLLAGAGVTVETTWTAVPPAAPPPEVPAAPGARRRPAVGPQPRRGSRLR